MRTLGACLESATCSARSLVVHREWTRQADRHHVRLKVAHAVAPHLGCAHATLQQWVLPPRRLERALGGSVRQALRKALVDQATQAQIAAKPDHQWLAKPLTAQTDRHLHVGNPVRP